MAPPDPDAFINGGIINKIMLNYENKRVQKIQQVEKRKKWFYVCYTLATYSI